MKLNWLHQGGMRRVLLELAIIFATPRAKTPGSLSNSYKNRIQPHSRPSPFPILTSLSIPPISKYPITQALITYSPGIIPPTNKKPRPVPARRGTASACGVRWLTLSIKILHQAPSLRKRPGVMFFSYRVSCLRG